MSIRCIPVIFVTVVVGLACAPSAWAVGGPVILGGDDLTDHGGKDVGTGDSLQGWLYIEKAVGSIRAQVSRGNDNTIAAFGSSPSGATSSDAGAAIGQAAAKNGMTVQYFDGPAAMTAGFQSIQNGSYRPALIWIAGSDSSNNLDSCSGAGTEGQVLIDNAAIINAFVTQGGGLMSHGLCYDWLSALLPGLTTVDSGGSSDLYKTPEGIVAFPGVSETDFNAGPWHNHFEGNFGGLSLLVRSNQVDDAAGQDAAVVIGGAQVTLTKQPAAPPTLASQVPIDSCQRRQVSLIAARVKGDKVLLSGLVSRKLAGRSISILGNYKAAGASRFRPLTSVKANVAGQFTASVPRPSAKKLVKARFRARVGKSTSVSLKLPQSLRSSAVRRAGTQVEVRGKVKRSVLGKRNRVVIKRIICGKYKTVGSAKPDASGNYVARFRVSTKGSVALFRAESLVLRKPGSKHYVKQYARAVAITVTDHTG